MLCIGVVHFLAGIPDSGACCILVEFNKDSLLFTSRDDLYHGIEASRISLSKRYIASALHDLKTFQVADLETGTIIYEDHIDKGSLHSTVCSIAGYGTDITISSDETMVEYGVYSSDTVTNNVCDFQLLETREYKITDTQKRDELENELVGVIGDEGEIGETFPFETVESTDSSNQNNSVQNSVVELWHLKTSSGTEFLTEPDDSFLRDSYEMVARYQFRDLDYEIVYIKKANTVPDIFYAIATKNDQNYLLEINTQTQVAERLATLESQKSDYTPSMFLEENNRGMFLLFPSCTSCDPVILDRAVYLISQGDYRNIGIPSKFEWTENGYRYKEIPDGCNSTFNYTFEPVPSERCEQQVERLDWIEYSPD